MCNPILKFVLVGIVSFMGPFAFFVSMGLIMPIAAESGHAVSPKEKEWFEKNYKASKPIALPNFYFAGMNRWFFVHGLDAWSIANLNGSVLKDPNFRMSENSTINKKIQLPIGIQLDPFTPFPPPGDSFVRYFNRETNEEVRKVFLTPEKLPPGHDYLHGEFIINYIFDIPENFDILEFGRFPQTMKPYGEGDWITIPLHRYSGGYDEFEVIIFLDTKIEENQLRVFLIEEETLEPIPLKKVGPELLGGEDLSKEIEKAIAKSKRFEAMHSVFEEIPKLSWNSAFRIKIPNGINKLLAFHFKRVKPTLKD